MEKGTPKVTFEINSILDRFWVGLGKVLGGFWEGFGRVLGGSGGFGEIVGRVWGEFGGILDAFGHFVVLFAISCCILSLFAVFCFTFCCFSEPRR